MQYDIEALTPLIGPPCQRHEEDGVAYWYGSGRITVCLRENIFRQTSRLFRHLPDDADIHDVIREMGERVKELDRQLTTH